MTEQNLRKGNDKLSAALTALRSEDVLTQNEGVAAAIELGAAAVSGLLSLLKEGCVNYAQVMYALSKIGDVRAEKAFLAGLLDGNQQVRAYAAQGLVRTGHPDALTACLETLNDAADKLHGDITPSVLSLGEMGLKAVPPLLDLLMDDDEMTRLHSQRALELILSRRHGFSFGQGFPSPDAEEKMSSEWRENGNYQYSGTPEERAAAQAKWRVWLATTRE